MSARVAAEVRRGCRGALPLDAHLEDWQIELCSGPGGLAGLIEQHGSPLNLLSTGSLPKNADELQAAADERDVPLRIFFARKANKSLAVVEEAHRHGMGIDLAGERELEQVLDLGVPGEDLIMTAAIKPRGLIERCLASGTTIVIDNADELAQVLELAAHSRERSALPGRIALRLAPEPLPGATPTRFGTGARQVRELATRIGDSAVELAGIHFHLDGYSAADRVRALGEAIELTDALRADGHRLTFVDIGGGIPMSYLDSAEQWRDFWTAHREALRGLREPLTFEGDGLGYVSHGDGLLGRPGGYPYHQEPVRGGWLGEVLDARLESGETVAAAITARSLELRCEPGRALLDGCGLTAARVEFRKQRADGVWLIGLAMNRTQCRSTSADFMVDPLLVRPPMLGSSPTEPIEGYLVGAYCIERELLTLRRLEFPAGVAVGDVLVFPNTAGYLMHILESSSHQIPLAKNVIVSPDGEFELDPIDAAPAARDRSEQRPPP